MTISGVKIKKTDGTWAGGASKPPVVQDFTSSGTWTKPDGARLVRAELISGGGPGTSGGSSGGGGGYAVWTFDADSLGPTETVTVGAGAPKNTNSVGGSSSFSVLTVSGGGYSSAGQVASGGGWLSARILGGSGNLQELGRFNGGSGRNYVSGSNSDGMDSQLGAGGGAQGGGAVGHGGTLAAALGALQAGNGGNSTTAATTPGGGGGSSGTGMDGAPGAARITTYF